MDQRRSWLGGSETRRVQPSTTGAYPRSPGFQSRQLPLENRPLVSPVMSPSRLAPVYPSEAYPQSPSPAGKPRTFAQWVAAAREATADFRRNGSPDPFVWILVENKNFPTNALVAGDDRREPLYVARSFYEGGIHIGKAGYHMRLGASIPYNGREIEVSTFEILVTALQPVRYVITEGLQYREREREREREILPAPVVELRRLNEIKTVILVDDSSSMAGNLWGDAREALAGIAELANNYDADGVDVFFLNSTKYALETRSGAEVRNLFDSVVPEGQTPTGEKLQEILDRYIPFLEDGRAHKPITIVIITDGVPTDDPKQVIVDAARRLDRNRVPVNQLGIQFAQIGDDPEATVALRELHEGLSAAYNIRDMVDTTLFNPNSAHFTTDTMTKILLGAINGLGISASISTTRQYNVPKGGYR